MQKPIRYYITKSGEEPTVRSVTVALGAPRLDDHLDDETITPVDETETLRDAPAQQGVKRRVKEAIRKCAPRR